MASDQPCACIVGVGPGLGAALAERFGREGHTIALLSRSTRHRDAIIKQITAQGGSALGYECDATNPASVAVAFAHVRKTLGDPAVLIYNVGSFAAGGLMELDPGTFENAWRANCYGGFLCAREVVPAMKARGRGTLLFTGATASKRGSARFSGLAVGKFGLRALAQSLAREFAPDGIHVAHVVIDGHIGRETAREPTPDEAAGKVLAPRAIAETYWQIHCQDRSAWTLELDLRPYPEHF
ncbi:MAG: SDR family NAD(P)-dependent oxidoreductase [Candidimonas sp.]|nr:MAG: SDR family NAD(P)-dependent oxidoreductase [Candidimonas sp.]